MRKSNRGMRFAPLCSLTQLARPETVAGTQAMPAPGVNRPVHDRGSWPACQGEWVTNKGVKRRDLNHCPRAKRGGC